MAVLVAAAVVAAASAIRVARGRRCHPHDAGGCRPPREPGVTLTLAKEVLAGTPTHRNRVLALTAWTARNDIREFLVSRRAKLTPEQVGLPAYGTNRRVAGLRREEVAMLAGISVEYYTRLERGNTRGVSEDVLEGITRALQLDEAERAHLFDLVRATASTTPARRRPSQERVRPS